MQTSAALFTPRNAGPLPTLAALRCSDCGRETSDAIADDLEALCNRCLSLEFVATAELLRESSSSNERPFGLGSCEIPSSEITQTLRIDPPTPGAIVFILLSAIASVALGGVVLGVAYLSA